MDPYKILGVNEATSDDDVKRAYRDLAKKYHPDNYLNSPLADKASEKMKQINEAYDLIMDKRRGKATSSNNGYSNQSGQSNPIYSQIRTAINTGNIRTAEEMLNRISVRDGEWHFLMGSVYYRKGWFDEARNEYRNACSLAPNNLEYRNALNMLEMNGGYGGYRPLDSSNACSCCADLLCMSMCCNCCGNGCC